MGGIGEGGGSWTTAGKIHRSLQAGGPSRVYVTNFTRNKAVYLKYKSLDRDHDGIACEKR